METQFVVMVLRLLFIWAVYFLWVRFCKRGNRNLKALKEHLKKQISNHPKKCVFQFAAFALTAVFLFTPASAQLLERVFHTDVPEEEPWAPELLPAIKSVRDVFPEEFSLDKVEGSFMLALADGVYNSKQTGVKAIERQCHEILLQLERHKSVREAFEFPEQFQLHDTQKRCEYRVAGTLEEYDAQIAWFVEELQTVPEEMRQELYHQVGITALNALYLCKEMDISDQETYWYYSELAFWGLMNEYVCMEPDDQALVDLFYRMGQAYDYLGMIAKDLPDFRYRMYFLSAAFLRLSCDALESTSFSRTGVLYWDDSWHLYLTMLHRLGLYMDAQAEYFQALTEYADVLWKLDLTVQEEQKLLSVLAEVQKWPT